MGFQFWHGPDDLVFGGYQDDFFFSHNPKIQPLAKKWVKGFLKINEGQALEEPGGLDIPNGPDKIIPEDDLKRSVIIHGSTQFGSFPVI